MYRYSSHSGSQASKRQILVGLVNTKIAYAAIEYSLQTKNMPILKQPTKYCTGTGILPYLKLGP